VAAEPVAQPERSLEVHALAWSELSERRPAERLGRHLDGAAPPAEGRHGETRAVDGYALADREGRKRTGAFERHPRTAALRVDPVHPGRRFDDAREHRDASPS